MSSAPKSRRSNMANSSVKQPAKKDGAGAYGWGDRQISAEYEPVGMEGQAKISTQSPTLLAPAARADSYHGDMDSDAQFPTLGGKPHPHAKAAPKAWAAQYLKKAVETQATAPSPTTTAAGVSVPKEVSATSAALAAATTAAPYAVYDQRRNMQDQHGGMYRALGFAGKIKVNVGKMRNRMKGDVRDGETDLLIKEVREKLVEDKAMAFPVLCYTAVEHASEAVTHLDEKLIHAHAAITPPDRRQKLFQQVKDLISEGWEWMNFNKVKSILMILGLGCTAFKGKTIGAWMNDKATAFTELGKTCTKGPRFCLFVLLMIFRLIVSTLVPPTSPAFGIILQAATPNDDKWTAMPFFLLASTVAGAVPYLMDKILEVMSGNDFRFSEFMHDFAGVWPLTCWTKPAMEKVFCGAGGGRLGASTAVIFAHAAPFMGAQTTMMQRYFLPHPLDTIISQPFGMSEDLISMAIAEAGSNPALASYSLTALICSFNFAQFFIFSKKGKCKDVPAFLIGVINALIGIAAAYQLLTMMQNSLSAVAPVTNPTTPNTLMHVTTTSKANKMAFAVVFAQLVLQLLLGPWLGSMFGLWLGGSLSKASVADAHAVPLLA